MYIVKNLIRTLNSSTESTLRTMIGPSHPLIPWIIQHAVQLKNKYMVGADGRTSTERLIGRGVQRPVYEFPARRGDYGARSDFGIYLGCRSLDGQAPVGTPSGVISCRTVRQVSAGERWDGEYVHNIKGTVWSPYGERARDVNIRVDLPVRIRQILTHQSSPAECASLGRRSRGLASPPNAWVAVPSELEKVLCKSHRALSWKD